MKKGLAENIPFFYDDYRSYYMFISVAKEYIFTMVCRALRRDTSFGRTPRLNIISQRSSRESRSKAFIARGRLKEARFQDRVLHISYLISCFKVKVESIHPRIHMNPFYHL
jgi:hypothetical protein